MEIVDAQIHAPTPALEWDPTAEPLARIERALAAMDAVGVDAAILHDEPRLCELATDRAPDRLGAMVIPDPGTPGAEELIAESRSRPGILGIRIVLNAPRRPEFTRRFRDGALAPWFSAAERHGIPVSLYVGGQLADAHAVARAHPALVLLIDHLGLGHPPRVPAGPACWEPLPLVLDLARYPNVALKFSGVPALSPGPYPFADVWPHAHRVIEAFGPGRLAWGSDYTRTRRQHTYAEAVNFLRRTGEISEADKREMLGGTIRRWLRWPRPDAAAV